jgi:hypothetical protein
MNINRSALSDGVLLFSFSFITLGIEERTLTLFDRETYTIPDWIYTTVGTVSALVSILLLIAAFNKQLAYKINNIIEGSFGAYYWSVFWVAYTACWTKGIIIAPQGEFIFHLVVFLGAVWFTIITIIWIRSIIKNVKWIIEFSHRSKGK